MKALTIAFELVKLLPIIIELIMKAEDIFGSGTGEQKKNFVLKMLGAISDADLFKEKFPMFDQLIDRIVAILNDAGVFSLQRVG